MEDSARSAGYDDSDPFGAPGELPSTGNGSGSASTTGAPTSPHSEEALAAVRKEKARVRFNSNAAATKPPTEATASSPPRAEQPSAPKQDYSLPKPPRPSILRGNSYNNNPLDHEEPVSDKHEELASAAAAQERAKVVADKVRRDSPTHSSRTSLDSRADTATTNDTGPLLHEGIPLQTLGPGLGINEAGESHKAAAANTEKQNLHQPREEAFKLVRAHTRVFRGAGALEDQKNESAIDDSRTVVPSEVYDGSYDGVYNVPPPQEYRGSVLSQLLKLYKPADLGIGASSHKRHSSNGTAVGSREHSGAATPTRKKWYDNNKSTDTLANLIEASARLANPNIPNESPKSPGAAGGKKWHKRTGSSSRLSQYLQNQEARITVHIAETLARQDYIIKLCRALMLFGAPTHRLEEYLAMTARVLEIDGQFLYLPGCMIISFDDKSTHTAEVRIVRASQGIDLGKLKDVHQVYKEVMHDVISVEDGTTRIEELINKKDKFPAWFRVIVFGLTSAAASPFSFNARFIDLPIIFCFGCLIGLLQLIVTPRSNLYNNVFEVSSTVVVSFLARAFGSINGGKLFCYSALAQGGIVMLLPGYSVLCAALELQARALIPGSIRIIWAIIYSLLLGFGITAGAAIYGLIDSNPTSATTCQNTMDSYVTFAFVPFFVLCICMIYQAKWRQIPVMIVVSFAGYVVNFFSGKRFAASPSIANTFGALAVGVLANLYSRIRHGVAAAVLVPAVFCQVPGGLAATGGLLSGVKTADMLANATSSEHADTTALNTESFNVAASMIQIAIGIAVGLFISALVVYPLGKRRSGLFSL